MNHQQYGNAPNVTSEPCCSKSLGLKPTASKGNRYSNDLIIIDEEDSNDSAYETGSALSRTSSMSSPTAGLQEIKHIKHENQDQHESLYFYANVNYDQPGISPWKLCFYKGVSLSNKIESTIVISDSDDDERDDDLTVSPNSKNCKPTVNAINSSNDEIINLDSDDDEDPIKYHLVEYENSLKKIPDYYMANAYPHDSYIELSGQTRVIARRKSRYLPVAQRDSSGLKSLFKNDENAFYAGIIGYGSHIKDKCWYYLVFFDDGHVQYVSSRKIRQVFGNYGSKYVHPNAQRFYDYYFFGWKHNRIVEMNFEVDKFVRVYLNGKFQSAQVLKRDPVRSSLALLHFLAENTIEWLYVGSPRIERIWTTILKDEKLNKYHDANTTMIEVSSDSEEEGDEYVSPVKKALPPDTKNPSQKKVFLRSSTLIDNYMEPRDLGRMHTCNRGCVQAFERNDKIFDFDPLKRPLVAGWMRKVGGTCTYVAPCGRAYYGIDGVHKFLSKTKSKLSIDCFSFSTHIDCMMEVHSYSSANRQYFLNDLITGGWKEKQRIPVVPISTNLPHFKEYVTEYRRNPRSKKVPAILNDNNNPFRSCCDCTDDCSVKSKCSCRQLTLDGSKTSTGYKNRRLLEKVETGIYECNPGCKCASTCMNRVVSAQIEQKLELYETKDRGYGIRCQTDLPKGTFVSCYFGDLLHGKTADERAMKKVGSIHGDEYFMQLDHIEVAEQFKDGYESNVDFDADDFACETPSKRFKIDEIVEPDASQSNGTNEINRFFPKIQKKRATIDVNQRTILYGENAVEFVVDGRFRGNISRFYNHSCQPNIFSQNVFVDTHDLRFPWLAFFTCYDIKAGTELTWDYGYQIGSIEGRVILCKCGAEECRKRLL